MEVTSPTSASREKLRILYVITKSNWGGAQRYVYDLAVRANELGHEVGVAAGGNGELLTRLRADGISVHPITTLARDVHILQEFSALKELYRICRASRPDVVHVNSSKGGLALLAARCAGVRRVVFTVHGWAWNEERPLYQKALIGLVYWVTLLLSHRAIVVSYEARRQARFLPFVQGKMRVVHNGVRAIAFEERTHARTHLLPDSDATFWIGVVAELHPIKGLDTLIEAFEHFVCDFPQSELVIIGEGNERGTLERQIQLEGVSGRVHLLGHISEAAKYLSALDVFVLPSRSEGLAYVLLEAGLASLPVVATRVGGIPEVIIDTETGLLVPYGNREALTEAFATLAKDSELRRTLGSALHTKITNGFSLSVMAEQTFALY